MRSHTHIHTHIHISKLGQALTIANTTENFYSWASITDTELYSGKALILKSLIFFPKQDNNHWSLFMTCCVTVGAEELHKYLLSQVSLQRAGTSAIFMAVVQLPSFLCSCLPSSLPAQGPTCRSFAWRRCSSQEPHALTAAPSCVPPAHLPHSDAGSESNSQDTPHVWCAAQPRANSILPYPNTPNSLEILHLL